MKKAALILIVILFCIIFFSCSQTPITKSKYNLDPANIIDSRYLSSNERVIAKDKTLQKKEAKEPDGSTAIYYTKKIDFCNRQGELIYVIDKKGKVSLGVYRIKEKVTDESKEDLINIFIDIAGQLKDTYGNPDNTLFLTQNETKSGFSKDLMSNALNLNLSDDSWFNGKARWSSKSISAMCTIYYTNIDKDIVILLIYSKDKIPFL